MNYIEYLDLFSYDGPVGTVGIEQEIIICDKHDTPIPAAREVLSRLQEIMHRLEGYQQFQPYGYELSACQLETRTRPVKLSELRNELDMLFGIRDELLDKLGYRAKYRGVGPENMTLDYFDDDEGRYRSIVQRLPEDVLRAACRCIGVHCHFGVASRVEAKNACRALRDNASELIAMGDTSDGERMKLYKQVHSKILPPPKVDFLHFYHNTPRSTDPVTAINPRDCLYLVRPTVHGTVEFRGFGATNSSQSIVDLTSASHAVCFFGTRKAA